MHVKAIVAYVFNIARLSYNRKFGCRVQRMRLSDS